MTDAVSDKAWMSVRDAELIEFLLRHEAARVDAAGRVLRVLEWGAGRSTIGFTDALKDRGALCSWTAVEHHREYFLDELRPEFAARQDCAWTRAEDLDGPPPNLRTRTSTGVFAVAFDAGELRPFERARPSDRDADLDDYVALPARLESVSTSSWSTAESGAAACSSPSA